MSDLKCNSKEGPKVHFTLTSVSVVPFAAAFVMMMIAHASKAFPLVSESEIMDQYQCSSFKFFLQPSSLFNEVSEKTVT